MNNQQITKIINYFRLNHGFHSPYSFIVDGNFLKILVEKDINL
jgi:rRNA-processing protein FCF1